VRPRPSRRTKSSLPGHPRGADLHGDIHDDAHDDTHDDLGWEWQRPRGIFVLVPIGGEAGAQIHAIREQYDPKLAAMNDPHVTLIGSSGAGPIASNTPRETLAAVFRDIAASTPPFEVIADPPHRFVDTGIVSFPLAPRGPLRALHERIVTSGLKFLPTRFAFAPHATVSYYPDLTRDRERELLRMRLTAPIAVTTLELSLTNDPQKPDVLLTLSLGRA
jgi:2'-5' RNA ligase